MFTVSHVESILFIQSGIKMRLWTPYSLHSMWQPVSLNPWVRWEKKKKKLHLIRKKDGVAERNANSNVKKKNKNT